MKLHRTNLGWLGLLLIMFMVVSPSHAQTTSRHLTLGNPSQATTDINQPNNYLIVRDEYTLAYRRDDGIPGWVSWNLQASDLGTQDRYAGSFITDTSLPDGWYRVTHDDYTGSGYDRGHMTPSADRTATDAANQATFVLSNIIPQAPANNRGPWKNLEDATRDLVRQGNEAYIVSGGEGTLGRLANGKLRIPATTWKVILVLPEGDNDASRVTTSTTVIAIQMPNDASVAADWNAYRTSVDCIEQVTGYDFFSAIDDTVEAVLEAQGGICNIQRLFLPRITTEPAPTPEPAILSITEIYAAPPAGDPLGEYVRISNTGGSPADMTGWTLSDSSNRTYTFPSFQLAPGASVQVWVKAGTNDASNLYWGSGSAVWNNDGDTATLRDASAAPVDTYTYP